MNDEFAWRKVMRDLGGPVQPPRELWAGIAERIAAAPAVTRRRRLLFALPAVAALLLAFGAALQFALIADRGAVASAGVDTGRPAIAAATAELRALRNPDPRLAGAMVEVDSAAIELQQSLEQQPDAVFLVGLLNRTYQQRMKLARMGLASS